jgi:TolB protein
MYISTDAFDRSQIFCINPDGSNLVQLTAVSSDVGVTQFTVNKQGTKIAYLVCDENGDTILHVMDSDGTNSRRITQTGIGSDSDPVFNLDGKTIYVQKSNKQIDAADISGLKRSKFKDKFGYVRITGVDNISGELIAVNGQTLCKISKTGDIKTLPILNACKVSSGKNKLTFHKFASGTYNIFASNTDGADIKQLTDDSNCYYDSFISPDDSKVTFCGYDVKKSNPGLNAVFVINIDGSGLREVIRTRKRPVNAVWAILDKEPKSAPQNIDWPDYWEKIIHPPQPDLMIASNTSSYRGKNQFSTDGSQKLTALIGSRRIMTYYIRLVNNGTFPDTFKLTANGEQGGWKCTYFHNTKNITPALCSSKGLISPPIAAGESYEFRVEVTPASNVKDDDVVTVNVNVSSLLDPQICDMVTAVTVKTGR